MRHELSYHFAFRDLRTSFVQKQTLYIKVHEQLQFGCATHCHLSVHSLAMPTGIAEKKSRPWLQE